MDRALRAMATKIIVAWGNQGRYQHRGRQVTNMLHETRVIHSLGVTASGQPKHPLYPKSDIVPGECPTERLGRPNDEKLIFLRNGAAALAFERVWKPLRRADSSPVLDRDGQCTAARARSSSHREAGASALNSRAAHAWQKGRSSPTPSDQ